MILFNDIKNNLNENKIKNVIINTNVIIHLFLEKINDKNNKINKEDENKIKYLLKFYELCYKIRSLYIYYFIIDNPINNIYNLNNEYLLFTGEDYIFIKYSISKREFSPMITKNFFPNKLIDYKNLEIKHITKDIIILNDFKNKIIYFIDNNNLILFKKTLKYYNSLIINENYLLFDTINNDEVQFSFINLTNFSYIDDYQNIEEILKFKLDNNIPEILSCYNNKFIYLFEQNQLCIVNYRVDTIKNNNKKNEVKRLIFKPKNEEIITPKIYSSSGCYSSDYDESKLFSDDSYYCSQKGSQQFLFFDFDDEYYFDKVEIIYHKDYPKSCPKKYSIDIFDKKKRKINTYEINNNNLKSEFIYLNEKGKFIKFNFLENNGGDYIIINNIYFYVNMIFIIDKK